MERADMFLFAVLIFFSATVAASGDEPPDIILFKDGSMMRGTISSMHPGDSIEFVTMSGKTQKFSTAQVEYAGPSANMPQKQNPQAPAVQSGVDIGSNAPSSMNGIKIRFTSNVPNLHLALRTTFGVSTAIASGTAGFATASGFSAGYNDIGFAPCDFVIAPGTYIFAFASPNKGFGLPARRVTIPENAQEMNATYISNADKRRNGWLLVGIGGVGGIVMMFSGLGADSDGLVLGGAAVSLGSTIFGVAIGLTGDEVNVKIIP